MAQKEYRNYTVLILGAGMGTRLRPITNTIPKVMVEIAPGKPLLQHTIELLRDQGFFNFIINLHYLPEKIIEYFGTGEKFGVSITYSDESERLMDTAGAIKKVEDLLSDTFVFMYGDELFNLDFRPLVTIHEKNEGLATIVLKRGDHPQNGDLLRIETKTGKIKEMIPRPHEINDFFDDDLYLNSGLYVLSKKIVDFIPADTAVHLDKEVMPSIYKKGFSLFAIPAEGEILDIGTPEKYAFARNWYQDYESKKGDGYEK